MASIRLTQNAVAGFQRALKPASSLSAAHHALNEACKRARYSEQPPSWLQRVSPNNDGYLLIGGDAAALPIRRGRAVACLANPRPEAAHEHRGDR
jgi:hypothetical protein